MICTQIWKRFLSPSVWHSMRLPGLNHDARVLYRQQKGLSISMETIAIIDYGMRNLRRVQKALEQVGAQAIITSEAAVIRNAKKSVLPGVGAMRPAMEKLTALKLIPVVQEAVNSKRPFLGICLGIQLLFDESDEGGTVKGLGVLPGRVLKFSKLKVPHMGWNRIDIQRNDCPLFY